MPYPLITTGDGSLSFYSPEYEQAFHNRHGAREEALEKFTLPCDLLRLAQTRAELHILDVCFGLGYNSGVALEYLWRLNPACQVHLYALELHADVPQQAASAGIWASWPFADLWQQWLATGTTETATIATATFQGHLLWGDARQTIQQVPKAWADAIFFDPFAPSSCPQLWTVEFFRSVAARLHPEGRLATYSCAAAIRTAMQTAGLAIGSTAPVGRPWPGTVAAWCAEGLPPLNEAEQAHLETRAAIPYRDPEGNNDRDQIMQRRQQEQQRSTLMPTSEWKRRYGSTTPRAESDITLEGHTYG